MKWVGLKASIQFHRKSTAYNCGQVDSQLIYNRRLWPWSVDHIWIPSPHYHVYMLLQNRLYQSRRPAEWPIYNTVGKRTREKTFRPFRSFLSSLPSETTADLVFNQKLDMAVISVYTAMRYELLEKKKKGRWMWHKKNDINGPLISVTELSESTDANVHEIESDGNRDHHHSARKK